MAVSDCLENLAHVVFNLRMSQTLLLVVERLQVVVQVLAAELHDEVDARVLVHHVVQTHYARVFQFLQNCNFSQSCRRDSVACVFNFSHFQSVNLSCLPVLALKHLPIGTLPNLAELKVFLI